MDNLIVFWLITLYGITQIIVDSILFKPFRMFLLKHLITQPFGILFTCTICTSTWVGFILSHYWFSPSYNLFGYYVHIGTINISFALDGFYGSCIIWFISLFEKLVTAICNRLNNYGDV